MIIFFSKQSTTMLLTRYCKLQACTECKRDACGFRFSIGRINYYLLIFEFSRSGNTTKHGVELRHLTRNTSKIQKVVNEVS